MVKEYTRTNFTWHERGEAEFGKIKDNFTDIQDVVNEHAAEITALAQRQTFNIQFFIDGRGEWYMARAGKHLRLKIINAFAMLGDSIDNQGQIVEIVGISEPLRFSGTEKAGKMKPLNIKLAKDVIGFWEDIKVTSTTDRRVLVSLLVETQE